MSERKGRGPCWNRGKLGCAACQNKLKRAKGPETHCAACKANCETCGHCCCDGATKRTPDERHALHGSAPDDANCKYCPPEWNERRRETVFPLKLHLKTITANGSTIFMVARDEQRRRFTIQATFFKPYFFVKRSEAAKKALLKRGLVFEDGPPGLDGAPTYKVTVKQPGDVGKRRRGFEATYEADVPYTRRFLVDMGIKDGFIIKAAKVLGKDMLIVSRREDIESADGFRVPDRIFHYDIETNKPEGSKHYSLPIHARGAVTCNTLHDTYDGTNFHTFVWHPKHGQKGKPRHEIRNRFSKAFKKEVDWHVHWFGTEYEMFEAMLAFTKKRRPDIMEAWNGHLGWKKFMKKKGGFDMPYLINRARNIKISPGHWSPLGNAYAGFRNFGKEAEKGKFECAVDGIQLVDSQTTYQIKDGGFPAVVPYSDLKRVVEAKLGYKMNKEIRKDITRWWLDDVDEFLSYSFDDVDATVGLEKKEGYVEWIRNIQQFVGAEDANRLFTPMSLISTLNLRLARQDGNVVPSSNNDKDDAEDDDYSSEGGFVMDPRKTGLQDIVAILDLSAMYVNIIRSCNISWETWVQNPKDEDLDDYICVPSDLGAQFFVKPEVRVGLMTKSCNYLMAFRKQYDDQIEKETDADKIKALKKARDPAKQLVLAVFGTALSGFFSLYRPEAGSAITGMGRHIALGMDRFLKTQGSLTTYQDTDSCFIPLKGAEVDEAVVDVGEDLCDRINVWFDTCAAELNLDRHSFEIGMEAICAPFVQGKQKKQYAGWIRYAEGAWQDEPKLLLKGVPGIKSDAAKITKEVTDTVVRMILNRRPAVDVLDYVRDVYESVLEGQVPLEDMVKAVTLNATPDETLPKPYYVHTAAKNGLDLYDFSYSAGEKVRLVLLKGIEGKTVAIPESEDIPAGMPVDYDHHASETVLDPIRGIFSWVGLDRMLDSIRTGTELTKAMVLE